MRFTRTLVCVGALVAAAILPVVAVGQEPSFGQDPGPGAVQADARGLPGTQDLRGREARLAGWIAASRDQGRIGEWQARRALWSLRRIGQLEAAWRSRQGGNLTGAQRRAIGARLDRLSAFMRQSLAGADGTRRPPTQCRIGVFYRQGSYCATHPRFPPAPEGGGRLTGRFGGDHVGLTLGAAGGQVEYDCGSGTIDEAIRPDAHGDFVVTGRATRGHGGPTMEGEVLPQSTVEYRGRVSGNSLDFTVRARGGGGAQTYHAELGRPAHLLRCL